MVDDPTTGLHMADVANLIGPLDPTVDAGRCPRLTSCRVEAGSRCRGSTNRGWSADFAWACAGSRHRARKT